MTTFFPFAEVCFDVAKSFALSAAFKHVCVRQNKYPTGTPPPPVRVLGIVRLVGTVSSGSIHTFVHSVRMAETNCDTTKRQTRSHGGCCFEKRMEHNPTSCIGMCTTMREVWRPLSPHEGTTAPGFFFFCFGKKNQIDHRIRHLSEGKTKVKGGVSDATIFSVNYFKRGFVKSTFKLHIFH